MHDIIGTDAAALILGAWKKQGAGAHALWLGAWSAPMLGFVWLSPDKAVRVAERGAAAIEGHLSLEDFRKMLGLIEHWAGVLQTHSYFTRPLLWAGGLPAVHH